MELVQVEWQGGFRVLARSERSEAAALVLAPGEATGQARGGSGNVHEGSDQWLFVLAGQGRATVAGMDVELVPGALLLIEAGEPHRIANRGSEPLRTLTFYAPPLR